MSNLGVLDPLSQNSQRDIPQKSVTEKQVYVSKRKFKTLLKPIKRRAHCFIPLGMVFRPESFWGYPCFTQ